MLGQPVDVNDFVPAAASHASGSGSSAGLGGDAGTRTIPNLDGRLIRARLYAGERVGDASLPLCLVSLCGMGEDDAPEPLTLVWQLDRGGAGGAAARETAQWQARQEGAAAASPPLVHSLTGLMSEQAAVMAQIRQEADGRYWLRLQDVHTLRTWGREQLPIAEMRDVTMISLQRRSEREWWLLVEWGDPDCEVSVLRLLLSHSAAALRAGAADDGAAAVQVLPYRTIPMLARDRQIDRIGIDPLAVRSTALPDWWSFDRFRWHVIACMLEGPDDETQVHLLDLAASGEQHGQWAGPNQAPVGWQSIETPVLDLRGLWGDDDERQQPSAILQYVVETLPSLLQNVVKLVVWDGGARNEWVRGTPASAALRGLSSAEEEPLRFRRALGDALGCVANWRFVVVVDAEGVHMLDFLPRRYKAAADGVKR